MSNRDAAGEPRRRPFVVPAMAATSVTGAVLLVLWTRHEIVTGPAWLAVLAGTVTVAWATTWVFVGVTEALKSGLVTRETPPRPLTAPYRHWEPPTAPHRQREPPATSTARSPGHVDGCAGCIPVWTSRYGGMSEVQQCVAQQ